MSNMIWRRIIKNKHAGGPTIAVIASIAVLMGSVIPFVTSNNNSNFAGSVNNLEDNLAQETLALILGKGDSYSHGSEWQYVEDYNNDVIVPGIQLSEKIDEELLIGEGETYLHVMVDDLYILTGEEYPGFSPRLNQVSGEVKGDGGAEGPEGGAEGGGSEPEIPEYTLTFYVGCDPFNGLIDHNGVAYTATYSGRVELEVGSQDIDAVCACVGNRTEPILGEYAEITTEPFELINGSYIFTLAINPRDVGVVGDNDWTNNVLDKTFEVGDGGSGGGGFTPESNNAPMVPLQPTGPTKTYIIDVNPYEVAPEAFTPANSQLCAVMNEFYVESEYRTTSADPDGDDIQIRFDWNADPDNVDADFEGNEPSKWSEPPMRSPFPIELSEEIQRGVAMVHTWDTPGTYLVRAQAKDVREEESLKSEWSKALEVEVSAAYYSLPVLSNAITRIWADFEICKPPYIPTYPNSGGSTGSGSSAAGAGSAGMGMGAYNGMMNGAGSGSSSQPINCFPAGTKIEKPDGTLINIEDIKIGDYVKAYNIKDKKMVPTVVTHVKKLVREGIYEINDGALRVTDDHPLFVIKKDGKQVWASINPEKSEISYASVKTCKIEIGDKLLNSEGKTVQVESIKYMPGETVVYSFGVISRHHNFFADDCLAHNYQYVLTGGDQENNAGDSLSVTDSLKISKLAEINADRLKEMLDIPDGLDINIKVYDNGVKVLDHPEIIYDDAKTSKASKNILIYHRDPEYLSRGSIEVTILG
jgi:hypothetical protein